MHQQVEQCAMASEFRPLLALALDGKTQLVPVGANGDAPENSERSQLAKSTPDGVQGGSEGGISKSTLYIGAGGLAAAAVLAVTLVLVLSSSSDTASPPPPSFPYTITATAFISSSVDTFQATAYESSLSSLSSPDSISTTVSSASVLAQTTMQYREIANASAAYGLLSGMSIIDLIITLGVSILSFDVVAEGFNYTAPSCTEFPGSACTLAFDCGQGGAIDRCSVAGGCGAALNQMGTVTTSCGPLTW